MQRHLCLFLKNTLNFQMMKLFLSGGCSWRTTHLTRENSPTAESSAMCSDAKMGYFHWKTWVYSSVCNHYRSSINGHREFPYVAITSSGLLLKFTPRKVWPIFHLSENMGWATLSMDPSGVKAMTWVEEKVLPFGDCAEGMLFFFPHETSIYYFQPSKTGVTLPRIDFLA